MDGLTVERQVELLGDVVHNHSIEIDQLYADCGKAWTVCNENFDALYSIDETQRKLIGELQTDVAGLTFWTSFCITALAGLTYFGYKAYKKHAEKMGRLEQRVDKMDIDIALISSKTNKKDDDQVEVFE